MSQQKASTQSHRSSETATRPRMPPHLYSKEYYLTDCEGHEIFASGAKGISQRLDAALELSGLKPEKRILDVGCGRGEAILFCALNKAEAYGIDYSTEGLQIAQQTWENETDEVKSRVHISCADAKNLPFPDESFDKLLMFDLVEHLYPWELAQTLAEARRVLAPKGQLVIHTAPNQWYYQFGYPLYRLFERLRGQRLPRNPRERFPFHYLHVNEQNVLGLQKSLGQAGFESKVWLENIQPPLPNADSPLLRCLLWVLLELYPFRWVFRNDIFAIAQK